jgi:hypothetical protein
MPVPTKLRLKQVILSSFLAIESDQELLIVPFNKLSNKMLPRYVELGERLDFSHLPSMQALSEFNGKCLFEVEGAVYSKTLTEL